MTTGGLPLARRRATATALLCATAAVGLIGCSSSDDDRSAPTTTADDGATTTTALVGALTPTEAVIAGQCLDPLPDPKQQTYAVLVVPCEDAHTYEVFAQAKLESDADSRPGAPYPGGLAVANAAEAQCLTAFEPFMGIKWEESDYDIQTWWPSEQSWTTKRDRTVLCAVYRVTGGRTKGSARASKQ